jgi:hypothetical protein
MLSLLLVMIPNYAPIGTPALRVHQRASLLAYMSVSQAPLRALLFDIDGTVSMSLCISTDSPAACCCS